MTPFPISVVRRRTRAPVLHRTLGLEAFIDVRLHADRDSEAFLAWATGVRQIIDAVHVTGPYDYLLRVRARDTAALDRLLRLLKHEAGAAQTQTRLALRPTPAPR